MKFYGNIPIFTLLFSILFSCEKRVPQPPVLTQPPVGTQPPVLTQQEQDHAATLSQNFKYTDSKDINAKYKALLKKYDTKMRDPMKNAILSTFASGHLSKDIKQEVFNEGFIKSGNALLFDHIFEFMLNPNMEFEDHELEPLFIRAIKHGKKKGKF